MRVTRAFRILVLALAAPVLATGCAGGLALVGLGVALSAGGGGGGGGGVPPVTSPFQVTIVSVTSESGTPAYVEGAVTIVYRLSHPDGARIRARIEYAGGVAYTACLQKGGDPIDAVLDVGPTPIERTFVWSTRDQGLLVRVEGIRLRVSVDPEGGGTPGSAEYPPAGQKGLSLDNAEPPTIEILNAEIASAWRGASAGGARIVAGIVTIPFVVADAEGDPASWRAEIRIGLDAPWTQVASGSIQPTPQGARGEFTWDSSVVPSEVVAARILVEDRYAGHVKAARIPAAISLRAENRSPAIASIEPARIPAFGEHELLIRATGFYEDNALQVLAGGDPAPIDRIEVVGDEPAIVARVSRAVSGRFPIVIVNPNGRSSPAVEIVAERVVSATPGQAEFGTVRSAIEHATAAGESDATIHVLPGTYSETLVLDRTSLVIRALAETGDPAEPSPRNLHVIQGDGAAPVLTIDGGGPHIRGFTITGGAGGIRAADGVGLVVEDCDIEGNRAPGEDGGGIRLYRTSGRIEDTTLRENEADRGGALAVLWPTMPPEESGTILSRVHMVSNRATSNGGGIFVEGFATAPVLLATCLLDGNLAGAGGDGSGGAAYVNRGNLRVVHVTAAGNRSLGGSGGGIYAAPPSEIAIANSILTWNDVDGAAREDVSPAPASVISTYVYDPPALPGSLVTPPSFVRLGVWLTVGPQATWHSGDYRLATAAPVIDAGTFDPMAWGLSPDDLATDLDGMLRDAQPDVGAFEWIGP